MSVSNFVDHFQDEDILANLTTAETRAFVDLLILTVMVDDVITEEELEGLAAQWAQLPFGDDENMEDMMGEHGFETREYLEQNEGDDDAIIAFLEDRTDALKTYDVKRAALRMVALVSLSDGVDESEQSLVKTLGNVLEIDESEVNEIIENIMESKG